jgi:hypothetical protein
MKQTVESRNFILKTLCWSIPKELGKDGCLFRSFERGFDSLSYFWRLTSEVKYKFKKFANKRTWLLRFSSPSYVSIYASSKNKNQNEGLWDIIKI